MLIGLVGLIGSGKDTVAERLVSHHGFVRDSFAKSLKDAVSNIFSWDREMLEGKGIGENSQTSFGVNVLVSLLLLVGCCNILAQKYVGKEC